MMHIIISTWAWISVAVGVVAGIAFFLSPVFIAVDYALGLML